MKTLVEVAEEMNNALQVVVLRGTGGVFSWETDPMGWKQCQEAVAAYENWAEAEGGKISGQKE
jgi:hypothetical protein